jgi:hypothetical protein
VGHALYTLAFTALAARWLGYELQRPPDHRRHRRWLVAMVAVQLVASALSHLIGGVVGNALLHALGGGAAAALLLTYLLRVFALDWPVRLQAAALFVLVSTLGVLNELGEYGVELAHLAVYSEDTHDTWRDLVANTTGAALTFLVILLAGLRRADRAVR